MNPTPPPRADFDAVLLAAGQASRMGHRPKALLQLDGVPLIRRMVWALRAAGARDLVVVLGHHAQAIAPALAGLDLRLAHNPDPATEQPYSLRCGLALLDGTRDVLVALADQPLIDAPAIDALLCAYRARPSGTLLVQPEVDGQPGNPVVFAPEVRHAMLAAPQGLSGRQWQAQHPGLTWRWPSTDPCYVTDLDRPADLDELARTRGLRLSWPVGQGF